VGDVVFVVVRTRLRLLEEDVDFGLAHLHAVLHLALAQPPMVIWPAISARQASKETPSDSSVRRNSARVMLFDEATPARTAGRPAVVDADTRLERELQLRLVDDQPLSICRRAPDGPARACRGA